MTSDTSDSPDRPDTEPDDAQDADGLVDSDDTTMADAGLTGGTGAAPGEGTLTPYGTKSGDDEDHDDEQHDER
jgi:hypothetical protein